MVRRKYIDNEEIRMKISLYRACGIMHGIYSIISDIPVYIRTIMAFPVILARYFSYLVPSFEPYHQS